jgi:phage tail-like protein
MFNHSMLFPGQTFLIAFESSFSAQAALGGFTEATLPTKLQGTYKVGDVTLKRGVVNAANLFNWIEAARSGGAEGKHSVVLTQRDETGRPVMSWRLSNASPKKYAGPTLGGKGNDLAIEELILSSEGIEIRTSKVVSGISTGCLPLSHFLSRTGDLVLA